MRERMGTPVMLGTGVLVGRGRSRRRHTRTAQGVCSVRGKAQRHAHAGSHGFAGQRRVPGLRRGDPQHLSCPRARTARRRMRTRREGPGDTADRRPAAEAGRVRASEPATKGPQCDTRNERTGHTSVLKYEGGGAGKEKPRSAEKRRRDTRRTQAL